MMPSAALACGASLGVPEVITGDLVSHERRKLSTASGWYPRARCMVGSMARAEIAAGSTTSLSLFQAHTMSVSAAPDPTSAAPIHAAARPSLHTRISLL